jgi:hypothetical protein
MTLIDTYRPRLLDVLVGLVELDLDIAVCDGALYLIFKPDPTVPPALPDWLYRGIETHYEQLLVMVRRLPRDAVTIGVVVLK